MKNYRNELESEVWKMPPLYYKVWQCLKCITENGQCLTSYRKLAELVKWNEGKLIKIPNPKTIKTICDWLELNGMIKQNHENNQYTLMIIVNWQLYQG